MTRKPSNAQSSTKAEDTEYGMKLLTLEYSADRGHRLTAIELDKVRDLKDAYLTGRKHTKKKRRLDIENCLQPNQTLQDLIHHNATTLRATAAILGAGDSQLKDAFSNAKASYLRLCEEESRQKVTALGLVLEMSYPDAVASSDPKQAWRPNKHSGGKLEQYDAMVKNLSLIQMVEINGIEKLRELLSEHVEGANDLSVEAVIAILEDCELPANGLQLLVTRGTTRIDHAPQPSPTSSGGTSALLGSEIPETPPSNELDSNGLLDATARANTLGAGKRSSAMAFGSSKEASEGHAVDNEVSMFNSVYRDASERPKKIMRRSQDGRGLISISKLLPCGDGEGVAMSGETGGVPPVGEFLESSPQDSAFGDVGDEDL